MQIRRNSHCRNSRNADLEGEAAASRVFILGRTEERNANQSLSLGDPSLFGRALFVFAFLPAPLAQFFVFIKYKGGKKMNKTKLFKILSVTALLILALSVMLTGCKPTIDSEGIATIVVANDKGIETYEVPLGALDGATGAIAALDYLKAEGKLDYTATDGGFGAYLTEVGHLKEDGAKGIYIGVWTSVVKDADTSVYATVKTYNGITLTSAGVGISSMSLEDGCIIYIGEIIYN